MTSFSIWMDSPKSDTLKVFFYKSKIILSGFRSLWAIFIVCNEIHYYSSYFINNKIYSSVNGYLISIRSFKFIFPHSITNVIVKENTLIFSINAAFNEISEY